MCETFHMANSRASQFNPAALTIKNNINPKLVIEKRTHERKIKKRAGVIWINIRWETFSLRFLIFRGKLGNPNVVLRPIIKAIYNNAHINRKIEKSNLSLLII